MSTGLAGVNAPSRKRGVSNGGEGMPLEPGLLGNCWCCLCVPRRGHDGWRDSRTDKRGGMWLDNRTETSCSIPKPIPS